MHRHFRHSEVLAHEPQQSELAALVERHTRRDGTHPTAVASLQLFRSSVRLAPVYGLYEPSLCLIAQGSKRVMLGEEAYGYDPSRYLLVSADLPVVAHVNEAAPQSPYLSLSLGINPEQIASLIAETDLPTASGRLASGRGISVGCIDPPLLDAVTRLVRLLETPRHIAVLAPLVVREILYLMLVGQAGASLRRMALAGGERQEISTALQWLKAHFAEPLRIENLARQAHMSPSVFHHHFKAVTAMTPLQYQKRLRLQEARRLMLGEAVDSGTAGLRVGYESPSQFSREYRRLFGESPRRDMARLRVAP